MPQILCLLLLLLLLFPTLALSQAACPLNFTVLSDLIPPSAASQTGIDVPTECHYIQQGLRLVESDYLRRTGFFLPPLNSSTSCWNSYQSLINSLIPNFNILSSCGFNSSWISQGCVGIDTRKDFEDRVGNATISSLVSSCNQSLLSGSPCAVCYTSLSNLHLNGTSIGNVSDCSTFPFVYAGAFANYLGPTDTGTAKCLFSLDFTGSSGGSGRTWVVILAVICGVGLCVGVSAIWVFRRRKKGRMIRRRRKGGPGQVEERGLDTFKESTNFTRFSFDEIKRSTKNFSRDYIIGRGGYGNVYRGLLDDGTEVALKRFKNCSAAGDTNFAHEVEVIASVRHVNLVGLRGYCIATTQYEGHQRIIVCDLMKNGSLHDHLFGSSGTKLSWPLRQKIALGTARGLSYLHHGAQPAIIHRDIKASNILLDQRFEPKVADFGLAKFTPEGMTHMSTRVAGTMGYVAPEYALYGQLTERSDVYSFGVVLLELLSGKKALMANEDQPYLITDWAWSLVRNGQALDVIEDGMPELGTPEVMEQYVLVAVLCSHPQLYARPTMDQVVKMLETEITVPTIPERPIPLVADIDDIERSVSSSSGQMSTPRGYQAYTFENDRNYNNNNNSNSDSIQEGTTSSGKSK
ncbi:hypothetical protein MLD38_031794 [Melastoma candidum]|uniref:Uncharacterized protein n=1 Tax=Melastoma candidum TaxID=119954 RepID=A0ACB9MSR3_9MYRT|nr:hypothetical protein MLD38_031794 [Melastoma candidum]